MKKKVFWLDYFPIYNHFTRSHFRGQYCDIFGQGCHTAEISHRPKPSYKQLFEVQWCDEV